jgi:type I restriction enzyme M protein
VTRQSLRDKFIAVLTELGGSAGNGKLRDTLGWADATYDAVKEELIGDGVVTPGRGRGGSVAIAAAAESAPAEPAKPAQTDRPARAERPNGNGANVGYEAELWRMADALRGSMDAGEYKHVALGLLFLKYISDAFEEKHAALQAEKAQGADPEDPDEYRAENIFWVPPEARWHNLKSQARQSTIGQIVDDAMADIERDNPALKGVLPKDYARPALDKTRLGQLIDLISNIKVGDAASRAMAETG